MKISAEHEERNMGCGHDIRSMNHFLMSYDRFQEFRTLSNPSALQTLSTIFFDWSCVFISVSLVCFHSVWWLPVALLIIGSRQRALVALTHDASHYLLAPNRTTNDFIANLFLCFPMVKSLKYYRRVHMLHHVNLGDEAEDADYLNDPIAMKKGWLHVYLKYLLSYDLWIVAELKQTLAKISFKHRIYLLAWWGTVLVGLSLAVSPSYAAAFVALWFTARAFMYHVITTFIIISDHHGLFPGSIVSYTRNHPCKGFVRWFIHPHNNGFHMVHHLAPSVPFYNLDKARVILKGWHKYDNAEQCDTYFMGPKSVVRSWGRSTAYEPAFEALEAIIQEESDSGQERKLQHSAAT